MMKLLLIDDDAFLRDMYAIKFGEGGHEVDVADGATAALRKIKRNPEYDVILLDITKRHPLIPKGLLFQFVPF